MRIIDVTKFGAVPNDSKDDTEAVRKAVEACAGSEPVALIFPKGTYRFTSYKEFAPAAGPLFGFKDINNLTIDAKGSTFILSGNTGLFYFDNCKNLSVKNIVLDWERPPFSYGEVIAANGNSFDVRLPDEYPVKGGEPVGAFMDYDPETNLPMRHGLDVYHACQSTELLSPQVLRVNLKHPVNIKPGVKALLRHVVYGSNGIVFVNCTKRKAKQRNDACCSRHGCHRQGLQ